MQVFKLGLMILKKKMPVLMIYVVIFVSVLFIAAVNYSKSPQQTVYSTKRFPIAFLTRDNGPVVTGLKESLSHTVTFTPLEDEPEALQDALFFNAVSAVLRIPEGFERDLLNGETPVIEKTTPPNAISGMNLDLLVNQYLQTIRMYAAAQPDMPVREMVDNTLRDLAVTTPVTLHEADKTAATLSFSAYFFNYLSYVYLSVFILGINALMVVFNNADLRQRNACSPIPAGRVSLQFFSVNLLFTFLVWLVTGAMFFLLNPDTQVSPTLLYFFLNALLYAFCAASISYLIGISLKESSAVSAVSNIVALGTSFLCGVFVPQAFLAEPVLRVAQFLPTYWYVRANNLLAETALVTITQQSEFTRHLLIQAGFGVACFILALVAGKRRNLQAA